MTRPPGPIGCPERLATHATSHLLHPDCLGTRVPSGFHGVLGGAQAGCTLNGSGVSFTVEASAALPLSLFLSSDTHILATSQPRRLVGRCWPRASG